MQDRTIDNVASPESMSEEFERLRQKHRKCEDRLAELRGRLLLSEPEKLEEVNLKKQKLLLKDRMETIARQKQGAGLTDSQ